jgi:hypothetical protein
VGVAKRGQWLVKPRMDHQFNNQSYKLFAYIYYNVIFKCLQSQWLHSAWLDSQPNEVTQCAVLGSFLSSDITFTAHCIREIVLCMQCVDQTRIEPRRERRIFM